MAGDIAKRLLRDPVKTKGQGLGRLVDVAGRSEARWNSLHGAEARALGLKRLDQSEVFENCGMQRVGQRVHVLTELDEVVTYRTHRLASDRIAQSLLLVSRINRKQSQALGNVIVQRARQPGAFILVSGNQASVEIASFIFSLSAFSDIDRYSAQLFGLAILIEFNSPPARDPTHGRIRHHHSVFRFVLAVAFERPADRLAQQSRGRRDE